MAYRAERDEVQINCHPAGTPSQNEKAQRKMCVDEPSADRRSRDCRGDRVCPGVCVSNGHEDAVGTRFRDVCGPFVKR